MAQQSLRVMLCKAKRHSMVRSLLTQYNAVKSSLKIPKMLCNSLCVYVCVCFVVIQKMLIFLCGTFKYGRLYRNHESIDQPRELEIV